MNKREKPIPLNTLDVEKSLSWPLLVVGLSLLIGGFWWLWYTIVLLLLKTTLGHL